MTRVFYDFETAQEAVTATQAVLKSLGNPDFTVTAEPETPAEKTPEGGLNALAAEIHENAVAHGWWARPITFPEILALCHSELSEALEEHRSGKQTLYCARKKDVMCTSPLRAGCTLLNNTGCKEKVPHGVAVELADCIIRILDYCGHEGIDIEAAIRLKHEYNKTRSYRHGGKKC